MNSQTPTTQEDEDDGKYVHLLGSARIGIDTNGKLTVTLLDAQRKDINPTVPITFTGDSIVLFNMHLVVELKQTELDTYKDTFKQSARSFVMFEGDDKTFVECMNPGGPPCFTNTGTVPIVLVPAVEDTDPTLKDPIN